MEIKTIERFNSYQFPTHNHVHRRIAKYVRYLTEGTLDAMNYAESDGTTQMYS
jgi:hypothetical protein